MTVRTQEELGKRTISMQLGIARIVTTREAVVCGDVLGSLSLLWTQRANPDTDEKTVPTSERKMSLSYAGGLAVAVSIITLLLYATLRQRKTAHPKISPSKRPRTSRTSKRTLRNPQSGATPAVSGAQVGIGSKARVLIRH